MTDNTNFLKSIEEMASKSIQPDIKNIKYPPFVNEFGETLCINKIPVNEIIRYDITNDFGLTTIEFTFNLDDGKQITTLITNDKIYEFWRTNLFDMERVLFNYFKKTIGLDYVLLVEREIKFSKERCKYCDTLQIIGLINCPACGGPY